MASKGARVAIVADVATSDHPGSPVTTTFTTVGQFLTRYNGASELVVVTPDV